MGKCLYYLICYYIPKDLHRKFFFTKEEVIFFSYKEENRYMEKFSLRVFDRKL